MGKKYKIIPKEDISEIIESETADEAIIQFATTMDTDMNQYFKAVPAESGPGKLIRISPDLEEDILKTFEDELNYHINESGCPCEYETEIEVQLAILSLLGYKEEAREYRAQYANAVA